MFTRVAVVFVITLLATACGDRSSIQTGEVGAFGLVVGLVGLAMLWCRVWELGREIESKPLVWAARGILVVWLLLALWVTNTYIMPVRSPIDGPKIEHLPPRAEPVKRPEELKLNAPRISPDMNNVAREHPQQLEKFEQKTSH